MHLAFTTPSPFTHGKTTHPITTFLPTTAWTCTPSRTRAPNQPPCVIFPRRRRAAIASMQSESSSGDAPAGFYQREQTREVKKLRAVLKKCSLYFVGPMGSGKTAVGSYLASELGFRFLDTDRLVESIAGKPIREIFADESEDAFRDLESAVLEQVTPFIGCCVATGGGIVTRRENWGKLHTGIIVYLETPVDVLVERLQNETANRPLLKDAESLRDRIEGILKDREHLYRQADVVVHCQAGMAVDEIGKDIIHSLTEFIKANPPKLAGKQADAPRH